jgi:UDP-N-acetylglucosamine 1-carboxyvinyltransferase
MDKIVIKGGRPLNGKVEISGAKNAALPILASTLLSAGVHRISNIPKLRDIRTMCVLLNELGLDVNITDGVAAVDSRKISTHRAPYELVKTMRASILVLGPLLARAGRATVSLPGGCAIGSRPIDQHLKGLQALGATISLSHGYVHARASRLKGTTFRFDISTVTGTENLMMAAAMAKGRTVLENAACEPEVAELSDVLNAMGARIRWRAPDVITIEGVSELQPFEYRVKPDRIEAGTFMVATAITKGDVVLKDCPHAHLTAVIRMLQRSGTEIYIGRDTVRILGPTRPRAVEVKTEPYPGFPTDMQAQLMALMCLARGTSIISETVFENRFMHVSELRRMGGQIQVRGSTAFVKGVSRLAGAPVMATDLRASASLVLAGLAADGITEISRVYHLDRGYERIENKLDKLGAEIRRVRE